MTRPSSTIHVRCKLCGYVLPGWLPVFNEPDGALLRHHLSTMHRDQVGSYLRRWAERLRTSFD